MIHPSLLLKAQNFFSYTLYCTLPYVHFSSSSSSSSLSSTAFHVYSHQQTYFACFFVFFMFLFHSFFLSSKIHTSSCATCGSGPPSFYIEKNWNKQTRSGLKEIEGKGNFFSSTMKRYTHTAWREASERESNALYSHSYNKIGNLKTSQGDEQA